MTRLSIFNNPYLLGFDHLERMLDDIGEAGGYPPYNIEQLDEHNYSISIAVAGFADDELDVTLDRNQLTVTGKKNANGVDTNYLHRGIATRHFERRFVLAEGIEVEEAHLDNGLLTISLTRPVEENTARTIDIKKGVNKKVTASKVSQVKAREERKSLAH